MLKPRENHYCITVLLFTINSCPAVAEQPVPVHDGRPVSGAFHPSINDGLAHISLIAQTFYHIKAVSYTHLRAHETRHDLVCRLLLEKKKTYLSSKQKSQ